MGNDIPSQKTISSLEARILELERENVNLKNRLNIRPRRDMWPESIMCKYELLVQSINKASGFWHRGKYIYSEEQHKFTREFEEKISRIIRWAVFGDTAKKTERGHRQLISVSNMTDEEFKIYLDVLDHVLCAFEDGLKKRKGANP